MKHRRRSAPIKKNSQVEERGARFSALSLLTCLILSVLLTAMPARASDDLAAAREALDAGLPQVAIYKLQHREESAAGSDEEETEKTARTKETEADLLLGRALLAAGRAGESVASLEKMASSPERDFWLAQAYAAQDKPKDALKLFRSLSGNPRYAGQAALGQARMLRTMNRTSEAIAVLTSDLKTHGDRKAFPAAILELAELQLEAGDAPGALQSLARIADAGPDEQRHAAYLKGRALMASGDTASAEATLRSIQNPGASLALRIKIALAECRLRQNDADGAEKILEQFIEENGGLPELSEALAALDRVYAAEKEASSAELRRWADDGKAPARAAYALFYHARNAFRLGREDKGRELFGKFLSRYPGHPLGDAARWQLATSYLATNDAAKALNILEPGSGPRIEFLEGRALAALGNYKEAAARFFQASVLPEMSAEALSNSALCAVLAGIPLEENNAVQALKERVGSKAILDRITFYEALHQASQRNPAAAVSLRKIARGDSAFASRAKLALAEWSNLNGDPKAARLELRKIASSGDPAQDHSQRAECLAVFLADSGDAESEIRVGTLAQNFLKDHPGSAFEPEVRMKYGEVLFRRGDYLGARAQFDIVAEKFPDSPLAEKAIFLSAQSMARSMNPDAMKQAIEIYNDVVQAGGPLAPRARLAQALLYNALQRPKDALGVLESILDSKPGAELRSRTLIEQGDTLFSLGSKDPENFARAIAVWQKIADDPAASKASHNQALVKIGAAQEKLGHNDAALDAYYRVFSKGQKGEPEYFWYYKAGFDAGRLLESQKLWKEAIVVYDTIGAIEGPRAKEAHARVNKLRLENFIWEN